MSLVEVALKKVQGKPHAASGAKASVVADRAPTPHATGSDHFVTSGLPDATIPIVPGTQRAVRVVAINKQELRAHSVLPPLEMELRIARQYQQIKRPLVDKAFAKDEQGANANRHMIMLASALSGEGKTFTSINLALSMALEKNIEVVLVDADVAKPHVSDIFGLRNDLGLLDLLLDASLHPDLAILPTNIPNLSILPAGKQSETATELLASERMVEVVAQLASSRTRRIVLFDSPPLLQSTESRPLISCVGQVVLIVRAGLTPPKVVQEAIDAVGNTRPVSLILNQATTKPSDGYYGYGSYGQTAAE
jgi:exopolysaccharide/PEP-CTERM locus tyrosine autokinase